MYLGSIYARHTSGFSFEKLESQFNNVTEKICHVQNRIDILRSASLDEDVMERVQKALGKRRLEEIIQTDTLPDISQWDLLNDITYFISHNEKKPKRASFSLLQAKPLLFRIKPQPTTNTKAPDEGFFCLNQKLL
jgi:hypothetical protein